MITAHHVSESTERQKGALRRLCLVGTCRSSEESESTEHQKVH